MSKERLSKQQRNIIVDIIHYDILRNRYLNAPNNPNEPVTSNRSEILFINDINKRLMKKGVLPKSGRSRWDIVTGKITYKQQKEHMKLVAKEINYLNFLNYSIKLLNEIEPKQKIIRRKEFVIRRTGIYRALSNLEDKKLVKIQKEGKKITNIVLLKKLNSYK